MKTFKTVVKNTLARIDALKHKTLSNGQIWPFPEPFNTHALEQEILNRPPNMSMTQAARRYVNAIEYRAQSFNGK